MTFWKIIWVTYSGLVLIFLHQHLWILCPVAEKQLNVLICLACAIKDSASQVALVVKNLPAKARDLRDMSSVPGSGRSPGGGHGNRLQYASWRMPWTEEPGGLQSMGSQRVGHDRVTSLTYIQYTQLLPIFTASKVIHILHLCYHSHLT